MATDMQEIEAAYRGCHERLCAVAGREIAGAMIEGSGARQMTPELFDKLFGG